jgi:SAM-dependent methyltransferase
MHYRVSRSDLRHRYNVPQIEEDSWHAFSERATNALIARYLPSPIRGSDLLLNAGCGSVSVRRPDWTEVRLDLFARPIQGTARPVCADLHRLPFASAVFSAVLCVGEVLGYCDPVIALRELARVMQPGATLIADFASTRSARYWWRVDYGKTAHMMVDTYNNSNERVWRYDPSYIASVLTSVGVAYVCMLGTHTWSAVLRRMGLPMRMSLCAQRWVRWPSLPTRMADVITIVAVRSAGD